FTLFIADFFFPKTDFIFQSCIGIFIIIEIFKHTIHVHKANTNPVLRHDQGRKAQEKPKK
mgnify:CR=1